MTHLEESLPAGSSVAYIDLDSETFMRTCSCKQPDFGNKNTNTGQKNVVLSSSAVVHSGVNLDKHGKKVNCRFEVAELKNIS